MGSGAFERYFNTIVQVCDSDSRIAGTGVIVGPNTIITCGHVAALALGLTAEANALPVDARLATRRPFVDGGAGGPVQCKVTKYFPRTHNSPTADIAVLELVHETFDIGDDYKIAEFADMREPRGHELVAFGFPEDTQTTIDQTVPATYRITYVLPNGWWAAIAQESYGQEIRFGFSGAPVMDDSSGKIIGMICEADASRRTATIIPSQRIASVAEIDIQELRSPQYEQPTFNAPESSVVRFGPRLLLEVTMPRIHYWLTVRVKMLADPAERSVLQSYVTEKKAVWADELHDKTYLPPPAKQIEPTPVQLPNLGGRFFSPIQQHIKEIAGLSTGGDAASAHISALSKRSRRVRHLVRQLMISQEPLILLGEPGSGKSLTLKQTALEIAEINSDRVFPTICLFIPLGRWRPVNQPEIRDVEQLVRNSASPEIRPLLSALADQQRLIVIFDGLDEMSREKYTQHTEALSRYAEKYEGRVNTLFSCRIADFSPVFKHRRLVLLPFERKHMLAYIVRQLGKNKLSLSGETFTMKRLAKRLDSQNLPLQPRNPFSLWLLTLYIRENNTWPETRVALLRFLYEYQFKRKEQENLEGAQPFPEMSEIFLAWGRLAREITLRNRGTDIGLHEIRSIFGQASKEIVAIGRICGVLQQSLDHDPPLVRFEHHRAQEFFTAYDIVNGNVSIAWQNYLDIPRWQETLVNVAQMEGGRAPLVLLGENLGAIPNALTGLQGIERARQEAFAAERVELAGRVLRATKETPERQELLDKTRDAARWLQQNGNPVSQVKMLRVAQEQPALDLYEIVRGSLRSPISWVRDQAHLVAASLAGKPSASPVPEEILASFSDGSILRTLGRFLVLAKQTRSTGTAAAAGIAGALFLINALFLTAIAPLLVHILASRGPLAHSRLFGGTAMLAWTPIIAGSASLVALATTLIFEPKWHWAATPSAGLITFLLYILGYALWFNASRISLASLVAGIAIIISGVGSLRVLFFPVFILGLISSLAFSFLLGALLGIWTRNMSLIFTSFRTTWLNGGYSEVFDEINDSFVSVLFMGIVAVAIAVLRIVSRFAIIVQLLTFIPDFPFMNRFFDVCIFLLLVVSIIGFALTIARYVNVLQSWTTSVYFKIFTVPLMIVAGGYLVLLFFTLWAKLMEGLFGLLELLFGGVSAYWVIRVLVALVAVAVACLAVTALAFIGRRSWIVFRKYFFAVRQLHISEAEFRGRISRGSAEEQAILLSRVEPSSLGLTADAFFDVLVSLETVIKQDPAATQYFAKRAQIQELLRHERVN